MKFLIKILFFYNFLLLAKSYDLDLCPLSRNVLCFFNVNKNCSNEYLKHKDQELNTTAETGSILEEHKKNRWVYLDHYIYETSKYYVVPFALPYNKINKVFVFFPNSKFSENDEISFKTLNVSNVCYKYFFKSSSKFSCIFDKDDLKSLMGKKISLYTIINFKDNSTSSIVFDVILQKSPQDVKEYSVYIDKYKLPNNFDYTVYLENKNLESEFPKDNTSETMCEKNLDLEKCFSEKYLIDPCDNNKFFYCYKKMNKILKTKLHCNKNLIFNNIFKFCEKL